MHILVDTREGLPLWSNDLAHVTHIKLDEGDYTTQILKDKLHIERKSPQDLYQTLTTGHQRFKKELLRAKSKEMQLILMCECSEQGFYAYNWATPQLQKRLRTKPETFKKILDTIKFKYGIDVIWCCGREDMREKILQILTIAEINVSMPQINVKVE